MPGRQCYSPETCEARTGSFLTSSIGYASSIDVGGVFDDDPARSVVAGYNKVYVAYCTSDGWIGDAAASNLTWNWSFRGQRVVREVLRDLRERRFLLDGAKVLFGGFSAGARGMMSNVDFFASHLPKDSEVLGVYLDSPYYIDVPPNIGSDYIGFRNETEIIFERYNVAAVIPSDCQAAYPAKESWRCVFGQYRMPFVKTTYLLIASQYDGYQLAKNGADESYVRYWSSAMQADLKQLACDGHSNG